MIEQLYPQSPQIEDAAFLEPSPEFRKNARLVIVSIILFFVLYLLLLALSAIFLVACVIAGGAMFIYAPNFLTLPIGLGLIALGIMFFFFLIKFIFSKTKEENTYRTEIKRADQPMLFEFIKRISGETKTRFPQKVFVGPDVNAGVAYDSSFRSMFLPTRKNLEIGLGLVNSLNIVEFKAILAHEFGHFSQKSMRTSSYIYSVNRALYNLVYEYDYWDKLLSKWRDRGWLFGRFATATFWMVEGVRSLLRVAYNLININYFKLSREMEFHADLVAASVAGNKPTATALRKIDFCAFAYEYTMKKLDDLVEQGKRSNNVFMNHQYLVSHLGRQYNLKMVNGQPVITDEDIERHVIKSRVNIEDQWASHPTLQEREDSLNKIDLDGAINTASAWKLFEQAEKLQCAVTEKLYQVGFPDSELAVIEEKEFERIILEEKKLSLSPKYNGFYRNRLLQEFDVDKLIASPPGDPGSFKKIYSKESAEKIKRYLTDKNDLVILKQIKNGSVKVKYFEFDGVKYKQKDAETVIRRLKKELVKEEKWLTEIDQKSFLLNYQAARKTKSEKLYRQKFLEAMALQKSIKKMGGFEAKFRELAYELFSKTRWSRTELNRMVARISAFESKFKKYLKSMDMDCLQENLISEKQRKLVSKYVTSRSHMVKLAAFNQESFVKLEESFSTLYELIDRISWAVVTLARKSLKDLTDYQLELNKSK